MPRTRNQLNDEFVKLCEIEPQLWELYREARTCLPAPGFCANFMWYRKGGLKGRLCDLVGWEAGNPRLRTPEAYDLCYSTIYGALPDCRHVGPCGG